MIYDLQHNSDLEAFKNQVDYLISNKKKIEIKIIAKKRSITQNKALHKWFELIAENLNDLGITFNYTGLKGLSLESRFTLFIVKEIIIKPIIKTLFNLDGTKDLTTKQINELIDVINKFFAEKGVYLPFPSIETLINKLC